MPVLWKCPGCGSESDFNFSNCWKCKAPRPEDQTIERALNWQYFDKLRKWMDTYLVCLVAFYITAFLSKSEGPIGFLAGLGMLVLFILVIVTYIASIVYSSKIQSQLHEAGLHKKSSGVVIILGLILNPFCIGFFVPLWVLSTSNNIKQQLEQKASMSQGNDKSVS